MVQGAELVVQGAELVAQGAELGLAAGGMPWSAACSTYRLLEIREGPDGRPLTSTLPISLGEANLSFDKETFLGLLSCARRSARHGAQNE